MKMTNNYPATPLPWDWTHGGSVGPHLVVASGDLKGEPIFHENDMAFAMHAANAYQKLVAALRETSNRLRGAAHDLRVYVRPDSRSGNPSGDYHFRTTADQERSWAWEQQADEADALLRELGELK
jgi:hypothetical protein